MLASSLPMLRGGLAAHPVLRGGRSVLTCLLLSFAIIVAVPLQYASPPSAVSYQSDLATMSRAARYTVLAPAGLPQAWSPVSSAVALGGANGAGTVTWHLGYVDFVRDPRVGGAERRGHGQLHPPDDQRRPGGPRRFASSAGRGAPR